MNGLSPDGVLGAAREIRERAGARKLEAWKPWFPVIDYARCTNCMQCLSFCLFDVYGVSTTGGIEVRNQDNCKTECPACSRVCPEVAIMFPKYRHGPINGEDVNTDDIRREAMGWISRARARHVLLELRRGERGLEVSGRRRAGAAARKRIGEPALELERVRLLTHFSDLYASLGEGDAQLKVAREALETQARLGENAS